MNISISLDQSKLRKRGHPIIISIFVSKTDKAYPTLNYYSFSQDWDFTKCIPKKTHPQYGIILAKIYEINLKITKLISSDKKRSAKQIQNYLLGNYEDIFTFWEERIREEEKKIQNKNKIVHSGGNAGFYRTNLSVWRNFKKSISYDEITYDFIMRFKLEKSKTCNTGGINTYLKAIRAIYNEAVKRGVYVPENGISPFSKIMEKSSKTKDKFLTISEMKTVFENPVDHHFYRYFILCFLLGGLDFIDIASIKKSDVKKGRLKFERFKGNTLEIINNYVFPEAQAIFKYYNDPMSEYLLPLFKYSYKPYRDKYVREIRKILLKMGIDSYVDSKTPRYTVIQIGSKELYQNRDIIKELVGHAQGDTLSIYEGKFPEKIKDEVHRKIIDAVIVQEKEFATDSEFDDIA